MSGRFNISKRFFGTSHQDNEKKLTDVNSRSIKCVVVGDGAVGKTSLLISYTQNKFPTEYVPTIFDNYSADVVVDGISHKLGLFDTAGEEDYDNLRPLSYPGTAVFLACFAVDSPDSFANIKLKWIPELRHHCPRTPIILVGTKADLRKDSNNTQQLRTDETKLVNCSEAETLKQKTRLAYYAECSALTQFGVKKIFDQAITEALEIKRRNKNICRIL